ncbi:MAG TPA: acetyl-CoA carboxylase biotin carboxyl carrier protein [Bryobacteraceae bacterium]|jgi:acetyl-CoA carboxylase biotin carboxyl carrier protein|nr:acetyl-CoA carboxylase biotin carboxyl carrier protein [Bryobacteraceae bacterium]
MTIDEIKELLQIFNESGVGELEVQRGEDRLRIKRAGANKEYVVAPAPQPLPVAAAPAAPVVTAAAAAPARAPETDGMLVKSPIVGTYYDSPSPDAPPFVRVGDSVEPGQVLCIIESMKLMNEIEAETGGTVAAKLVENGRPVEYGEALFSIRPR